MRFIWIFNIYTTTGPIVNAGSNNQNNNISSVINKFITFA